MPLVYLNTYLRLIRKKEDTDRYKERFGYTNFKQILKKMLFGFMLQVLENLNPVIF